MWANACFETPTIGRFSASTAGRRQPALEPNVGWSVPSTMPLTPPSCQVGAGKKKLQKEFKKKNCENCANPAVPCSAELPGGLLSMFLENATCLDVFQAMGGSRWRMEPGTRGACGGRHGGGGPAPQETGTAGRGLGEVPVVVLPLEVPQVVAQDGELRGVLVLPADAVEGLWPQGGGQS